jgi:methyl-accepting chemotaxis protein
MEKAKGFTIQKKLLTGFIVIVVVIIAAVVNSTLTIQGIADGKIEPGQARLIGLLIGGLAAIFSAAAGIYLYFLIKPLQSFEADLDSFANGGKLELSPDAKLLNERKDEIGALARHLSESFEAVNEKVIWYEGILDSIPFPISVTDNQMNWKFINKPVEEMLSVKREDILGKPCSNWNAAICKTENCGVARLRKNQLQTFFTQMENNFQVDSAYLKNSKGENIGQVEVVQNITRAETRKAYLDNAVESLAGYLKELAGGHLAFEISELPPANQYTADVREDFTEINQDLSQAQTMLVGSVRTVIEKSEEVAAASEQMAHAAAQASQATSQIATTIQQVAKGTTQQSESISKTANVVQNVTNTVDGVSQGAKEQLSAVEQASEVATRISEKNGISEKVGQASEKVQYMGTQSEKIGAIVETIEDIASQTNLLALNAAIEAARAGEHGKGFAVVADEVRKLAERSSSSTKEIAALITEIQREIALAVTMTSKASQDVTGASSDLVNALDRVSAVVNQNTTATGELSVETADAMQAIENIASVSEENSAAVEEVSASTEEMSAQVEEFTASAQSLADMATALKVVVEKFDVGDDRGIIYKAPVKGKTR